MAGKRGPAIKPMRENTYQVLKAFSHGPQAILAVHQILPTQSEGQVTLSLRNTQVRVKALLAAKLLETTADTIVFGRHIPLYRLTREGERILQVQRRVQTRRQSSRAEREKLLREGPFGWKLEMLRRALSKGPECVQPTLEITVGNQVFEFDIKDTAAIDQVLEENDYSTSTEVG